MMPAATGVSAPGAPGAATEDDEILIVALGDSLTAGPGLEAKSQFPARLEAALKANGHNVKIADAGVSGDTASGGQSRVDWAVGEKADAVIVELGANDALRGIDPEVTEKALGQIVESLKARKLPVLLAGMLAPPNMGPDYARRFNAIYPKLAQLHDVVFYPFFLDGVAAKAALNFEDGMHPNEKGVEMIVERILPSVELLIARIKIARGQ